jgi:hypothetical protein
MFQEAKAGGQKAITAHRLSDGLVVFLTESGDWSVAIADARLLSDGPELDEAKAYAKAQTFEARVVLEAYAIDVDVVDGKPLPKRFRERIRAQGPTVVYGDAERAKLAAGA